MESPVSGNVRYNGISYSRGFQRFSEKRIERWILSRPESQRAGFRAYFDVNFQRAGEGHTFHCSLRIETDERIWTASALGDGPQRALTECLERLPLSPVTRLTPSVEKLQLL